MCISESEIPILTTHQAPTILKGVCLITYLEFYLIYDNNRLFHLSNLMFCLLKNQKMQKKSLNKLLKRKVFLMNGAGNMNGMYFIFQLHVLTTLRQKLTSDFQFQNQLLQKKKSKQLQRKKVRTHLKSMEISETNHVGDF